MESMWIAIARRFLRISSALLLWFIEASIIIGAVLFIVMCALLAMGKL